MGALREAFSLGHGRLSKQLAAAVAALDRQEEYALLVGILHHVRAHLSNEESHVFSVLDAAVPALQHVTLALRSEHQAFRRIIADVEERMSRGDPAAAAADLRELGVALELHERREIGDLCQLAEGRISPREEEDLAAALATPM